MNAPLIIQQWNENKQKNWASPPYPRWGSSCIQELSHFHFINSEIVQWEIPGEISTVKHVDDSRKQQPQEKNQELCNQMRISSSLCLVRCSIHWGWGPLLAKAPWGCGIWAGCWRMHKIWKLRGWHILGRKKCKNEDMDSLVSLGSSVDERPVRVHRGMGKPAPGQAIVVWEPGGVT